jgi:hypothetical protein
MTSIGSEHLTCKIGIIRVAGRTLKQGVQDDRIRPSRAYLKGDEDGRGAAVLAEQKSVLDYEVGAGPH